MVVCCMGLVYFDSDIHPHFSLVLFIFQIEILITFHFSGQLEGGWVLCEASKAVGRRSQRRPESAARRHGRRRKPRPQHGQPEGDGGEWK